MRGFGLMNILNKIRAMRHSAYSIFLFFALLLTACGGEEKEGFTITAEFDVPEQSYLYFWQEELKNGITVDTVLVEEGKAEYKGVCQEMAHIEIGTEAGERVVSLYVKNGNKIKLKGSIKAPYEITFSGTNEMEQVGKFRNDNHTLLQHIADDDQAFFALIDDTLRQKERALRIDTLHRRVEEFARANPQSYASTLLIYDFLLTPETVETADSLLRSLAPEAKPVSLLAKAEIFIADTRKNPEGKMLPYMTFRTPDDSVINTGGFRRRTTLFTVWASYDSLSRREMQVIRTLREKYTPAYLNIVSVSLDADKEAWRETLRSDSLQAWPHCLLEEGWNANQVENLGLQRIPTSFIINGNGRIVAKNLHGDELIEAVDRTVAEVGEDKTYGEKPSSPRRPTRR